MSAALRAHTHIHKEPLNHCFTCSHLLPVQHDTIAALTMRPIRQTHSPSQRQLHVGSGSDRQTL